MPPMNIASSVERDHQFERGPDVHADLLQHRQLVAVRDAPVAGDEVAGPVEVLDRQGPVQPVLLHQPVDVFLAQIAGGQELRQRPPGRQMQDREGDHRDQREQQQRLQQAAQKVARP